MTTPNEPNKTRTIPLHIADQAVAACEAEIQKLREENARLQSEVERLKGIILAQSSDFVRSKTVDDGIKPEGHNDLAGRAIERCLELQAKVERLAGEVNRLYFKTELLIECGDEMANRAGQEWLPSWVVEDWNNAKEGKQS